MSRALSGLLGSPSAEAADTPFMSDIGSEDAQFEVVALVAAPEMPDADREAVRALAAWAEADGALLRVKVRPAQHPDAVQYGSTPQYIVSTGGDEGDSTEVLFEGGLGASGKTVEDLRVALISHTGKLPDVEPKSPELVDGCSPEDAEGGHEHN